MPKFRSSDYVSERLWSGVVALWLAFIILTGGTSVPTPIFLTAHSIVGFAIVVISAWRLQSGFPGRLAVAGVILSFLSFILVAAQLVPLPWSVWTALPGRELIATTAQLTTGESARWMPLSLTPAATQLAFLDMLPAFASFLAVLTIQRRNLPIIAFVLLLCAVICVFIGLLQRNAPAESFIHFQNYRGPGKATGTFGNPNYFAMQLYCSLPFLAALAMTIQDRFNVRGWLVFMFAVAYGAIIVVGLAIIGSRAGIVMAMFSVLLSVLLVYRSRSGAGRTRFSATPFLVLGVLLIFGQVGMVGVLQLAGTDPLADYRNTIFEVSLQATRAFFPIGSGFGSFVPVYQLFETPDTILSSYVNHAHNDWLELVLEGGVIAAVLLAGFILVFLAALISVFQLAYDNSVNSYHRAAAVALLLILLHAGIDFGLRTPAIAAIAASCFAIMVCARAGQSPLQGTSRKTAQSRVDIDRAPIRPFSKPTRGFKTPLKPEDRKNAEGQT